MKSNEAFQLGDLRAGAAAAVAVAALGIPLGLLWAAIGPHAAVRVTPEGAVYADHRPEAFIGADGTFAAIGLVTGVVLGAGLYLWRRRRGPWMAIGLAAGSLAGAYVAWKVGHQIGLSEYDRLLRAAPTDRAFTRPVDLRAHGVLFLQPLVAVIVYVLAASWSRYGDLGRYSAEPVPVPLATPEPVSSGSAVPGAPPAAPARPPAGGASSPPA
jgi:hypothetical protein